VSCAQRRVRLKTPPQTVIAAVRDPGNSTSKALADLPMAQGSSLIVVKYDAAVEQDAFNIVKELQAKHSVEHLDIVVANAGIVRGYPLVKDVKRAEIQETLEVNVYSIVSLYQATRDLLQKSPNKPIFVPMGSGAGALG
jgi:NAD(P)-dependent dehydrogenase (short-subunit alcohol dehydrogenase family)